MLGFSSGDSSSLEEEEEEEEDEALSLSSLEELLSLLLLEDSSLEDESPELSWTSLKSEPIDVSSLATYTVGNSMTVLSLNSSPMHFEGSNLISFF